MIRFKCERCSAGLTAKDEAAGRSARCSQCNASVVVPPLQTSLAPEKTGQATRSPATGTRGLNAIALAKERALAFGDAARKSYSVWKTFKHAFLTLNWPGEPVGVRQCTRCRGTQFSPCRKCALCGAQTVGMNLEAWLAGIDDALQDAYPRFQATRGKIRRLTFGVSVVYALIVVGILLLRAFWPAVGWGILLGVAFFTAYCGYVAVAARGSRKFLRKLGGLQEEARESRRTLRLAETACEERVFPFLDRNDVELYKWREVPDNEMAMLRESLWARGIEVPADRFVAFLKACALKRDYRHFFLRLSQFGDVNEDLIERYAQLHVEERDQILIPFLQQSYLAHGEFPEAAALAKEIREARKRHAMGAFEQDLRLRKDGAGYNITIEDVDRMDPFNFELLLGMVFESQGYRVEETPKSGDQGADVLLEKAGERTVVQAKLYSHPVSNSAVQEAVAAKQLYGCQYALVVTNNTFTASAEELAGSNQARLIARAELKRHLRDFNRAPKDYARLARIMIPRARDAVQPVDITEGLDQANQTVD